MVLDSQQRSSRGSLIAAGVVIGLGLGGFFDGIVLHQILQWHHMFTSAGYSSRTVGGLEVNTLGDGIFSATTYILTIIGIALLWRAGQHRDVPWSLPTFLGSLLIGAGMFNLVEGIIDHHILGIHHVKSGPNEFVWDVGFLLIGAVLVISGWILVWTKQQDVISQK